MSKTKESSNRPHSGPQSGVTAMQAPIAETKPGLISFPSTFIEPWLTKEQIAERLQVKPSTVYEMTRKRCQRRIPFHKAGKYQRFKWSEVEAWMNESVAA